MKQINLIILILLVIYSCKDNSTNSKNNQNMNSENPIVDSDIKVKTIADDNEPISNSELSEVFAKAVQSFPRDSASLYRFYFEWNPAKDQNKLNKQIERLEKLSSNESIERYKSIESNLKPLMTKIVNSNTISKSQSDSLVKLYSDYDYFSGESLFSELLINEDNYDLVWKSFQIMVKESSNDTCFIYGLIRLDDNIRTNVELAEAMQDFIVRAIKNNPIGFLEMYNKRQAEQRTDFANYISVWDDPDKELIDKYSEISRNSKNGNYRKLAREIIENFKK